MSPTAATTRFARSRSSALAVALLCACGGAEREEELTEASVMLTSAPADAVCVRIVVVGARRTAKRDFDVGAGTVFSLTALPIGDVVFFADAFGSTCGSLTAASMHTWYGVPVRASLVPGTPAIVTIAMHR